jgi:hypothetical protein
MRRPLARPDGAEGCTGALGARDAEGEDGRGGQYFRDPLISGHHESSQGALAEMAVEPRIEVITRESEADADDLGQDHIPISMHPHLGQSQSELTGFPVCMKHSFQAQHSGRHERIDHRLVENRQPQGTCGIESGARSRLVEHHHDLCGDQGAHHGGRQRVELDLVVGEKQFLQGEHDAEAKEEIQRDQTNLFELMFQPTNKG